MDKFSTFSITVTEEIKPDKVLTFIRTQITLKNILTTPKSYFYFKFLPQILKYEVVVFQNREDACSCNAFTFSKLVLDKNNITLFITPAFFVLYQKKELLLIKKISDTTLEDIKSYIEQTYKLIPDKIIFQDATQKEKSLKNSCEKNIEKKLYKVIPDNSFKYFMIYSLLGVLFFLFSLYYNSDLHIVSTKDSKINNSNLLSKEFILYKKHIRQNSSQTLLEFLEFIKKQKTELKTIEYLNNSFTIKVISDEKKKLLDILEYSKKRLNLKSIKQDITLKHYCMEVVLHD